MHPGGPYWRKKDAGAWSIPKGEFDEGEDAKVAARREFNEETGATLSGPLEPLGEIRQRGGKRVVAFDRGFRQASVRGWRGCQLSCSNWADGRRPALAHLRQRSRLARS